MCPADKTPFDSTALNLSRRLFLSRSCAASLSLALYLLSGCNGTQSPPKSVSDSARPQVSPDPVTVNGIVLEDGVALALESGDLLIAEA